jgi:peptidoglycan/LPS O-acetylase OafA/YrhL
MAMVVSPFLIFALGKDCMEIAQDFGFIRCVYGFAAGVLCFKLYERFNTKSARLITNTGTLLEVVGVIGTVIFVQSAGRGALTFIAPLIFGFSVIVFARERGLISRALHWSPLVFLASLSYSIYMIHFFIQDRIWDGANLLEKLLNIKMLANVYLYNGTPVLGKPMLGRELWQGDLACVIMLLCVITASYLTHRFVEVPGQAWFRCIAKKYSKSIVLPAAQSQSAAAALVTD